MARSLIMGVTDPVMEPEMAEEDDQKPEELSLSEQLLAEEEKDVLFKSQMAIANFFLGYWKHMVALVGVALLGVLAWGLWDEYQEAQQEEIHQKIAEFESQLSLDLRQRHETGFPLKPGDDFPNGSQELSAVGGEVQALSETAVGVGATYARLRAASLWSAAGRVDVSSPLLEQSAADDVDGVLAWSAKAQLAATKVQKGDVDGAAAIYQEVSGEGDDVISQEALYRLGELYHDHGRNTEAIEAWNEFTTSYPADTRVLKVTELLADLQTAG